MKFGIHTLDDFDVRHKTVLCRIDINQPVDRETGTLKSTARIEACVPTIRELSDKGARVVLMAHQGSDIEYKNYYTTRPHAAVLTALLQRPVRFIEDVCGPYAQEQIKSLRDGEILLLDNVRFLAEEQTLFERSLHLSHDEQAKTLLVQKLAPLGDLYVCDAFAAAHRDQPSLAGFEQLLPSAMGRLFEKEYCILSEMMESPKHPCVFLLGGAKVADAFLMMDSVLEKNIADKILTGGLVANILLFARGTDIGEASRNIIHKAGLDEYIQTGRELLNKYSERIVLPEDLACVLEGMRREAPVDAFPKEAPAIDIGASAAAHYAQQIQQAATVFVNGPMGIFEEAPSEAGTRTVWHALGTTQAFTVVGGGDSITASAKYGITEKVSYICTGGGSLIRFLSGRELPVVRALREGAAR